MIDLSLVRLIRGVEEELQRAPQTRSWREQVTNALNAEMFDLLGSREWPFLVVQRPLWVFPDFTLTGTQITMPSSTPRRVFDIPSISTSLVGTMWGSSSATSLPDFLESLVGAEVGVDSGAGAYLTGNWRDGPFMIERVLYDGSDSVRLWLDPRCTVASLPADTVLNIRFPRYLLPPDLAEIIAQDSLTDERGVPLAHKPPAQFLALSQGNGRPTRITVGTPRYFTVDEGIDWQVPPDRLTSPNLWVGVDTAAPRYDLRIPPPQHEMTANASPGGSLDFGKRFRIAFCYYVAGRFGPLGNIYEVTTTDTNRTITATYGWLLPQDAFLTPDTNVGWYLAAFVAEGDGPLMLQGYVAGPNQARGSDYVVTQLANLTTPWKGVRYDDVAVTPPRFLRLLPRPSSHQRLSLRYRRRPTPLVHDEDVPPFPAEFHRALVYGAAARLAEGAQIGGAPQLATAARMRAAALQVESRMRAQYFPEGMLVKQKGMIGGSGAVPDPLDIHSIDYNGDT